MGQSTNIQWTDSTFNPWRGCVKVSPGCAHCYAETQSKRNPKVLGMWGANGTRVLAGASKWGEPLAWNVAAAKSGRLWRVFCASLADVFEDWPGQMSDSQGKPLGCWSGAANGRLPLLLADARTKLWRLILDTPHLTWQLLTKRPENVARMVPEGWLTSWPANVWLGASVEDQARADERIPHLLRTPAAVRFLSVEPLLGPVDIRDYLDGGTETNGPAGFQPGPNVDWVIVGGESGPHARPCAVEWVRSLVGQCKGAGVACFVKQLGACFSDPENGIAGHALKVPEEAAPLISRRLRDHKGGDMEEWPEDLRVREFPRGVA